MLLVPRHVHVLAGEVHGDRILTTRRRRSALLVGAIVAAGLIYGLTIWVRIDRVDADLAGSAGRGTTYLLIGSDRRADIAEADRPRFGSADEVPGERADIVIVVNALSDGTVRALSIPRDLVLFRQDRGPERLAPLLGDGPGAIADALCNSLGIGVDHLAVIHFSGIDDLVDLTDGVVIEPSGTFLDRQSGLLVKAGRQRVDGRTALAYVRARHIERREGDNWLPDPEESARRGDRALEVLRGLGSAVELGWNPWHDHRIAWAVTDAITVDDDMGIGDMMSLAEAVRGLRGASVESLPVLVRNGDVPTASITASAPAAVQRLTGTEEPPPACSTPTLLSGTG